MSWAEIDKETELLRISMPKVKNISINGIIFRPKQRIVPETWFWRGDHGDKEMEIVLRRYETIDSLKPFTLTMYEKDKTGAIATDYLTIKELIGK